MTALAFDLFRALARKPGNLFFSPLSVAAILEMAWAGARGATASEIGALLRLSEADRSGSGGFGARIRQLLASEGEGVDLNVASRLWGQSGYSFIASHLDLVRERYGADLMAVDFGQPAVAARIINAWVAEATHGRVPKLVDADSLSPLTRLVLTNAVYFRGWWRTPFDPSRTTPARFWVDDDHTVDVPLMNLERQAEDFEFLSADGWEMVELRYRGGRMVMDLIKPADAVARDRHELMSLVFKGRSAAPRLAMTLAELEARLGPETLSQGLTSLKSETVIVQVPRFQLDSGMDLRERLQQLGIRAAFSPQEADFSGITREKDFCLGGALHRSHLTVDEQGSEAAAATAITMTGASPTLPLLFRADHPFLLLIRDTRTGAIVFMGRVSNPA